MTLLDKNGNKIVIIGNGCAGAECIKALRENDFAGEIRVFTDSQWPIYNPMLTTYYASGKISFDQLFPYGQGNNLYEEYKVDLDATSPVVALDADLRVVTNKAGFEFNYDQCLIASGASPVLLPIEGIVSSKVFFMRTVEDAIRLKDAMDKKPRKALVIGASLIGIKLMEVFHNAGIKVCLVDLADHILPLNAHPECAHLIEDRLIRMGIRFRFNANINKLEDNPGGIKAYFNHSQEWEEADLAAICIGVKPNVKFIDSKQVKVDQGILVDEQMRTNVPGLYAAGDVSQGTNLVNGIPQVIGLWANARYQGRTAGRNMAGIEESFQGNIPHNIAHFLGMDLVTIGDIRQYDRMERQSDGKRLSLLFWKNGRLTGANFIDSYTESGVIKSILTKGLSQNQPAHNSLLPLTQDLLIKRTLREVEKT